MRMAALVAYLGLTVVACVGDIPSQPGGGGGGGDANMAPPPKPAVTIALTSGSGAAMSTLLSDLYVDNTITVTVTGSNGFAGTVSLAAAIANATTASITDWNATFGSGSDTVTLDENGTATTTLTLEADGDVAELAGTLTITATSSAASVNAAVQATFNPVMDVFFSLDVGGNPVYPQTNLESNPYRLTVGRQIAIYNNTATDPTDGSPTQLITHTNATIDGFPHESILVGQGTSPGQAYVNTVLTAGQTDEFYWHGLDNLTSAQHPHLTTVAPASN